MGEIPRHHNLMFKFRSRRIAEDNAQSAIDRRIKYSSHGAHNNKYETNMLIRERRFRERSEQREGLRSGLEPHGILIPSEPTIQTVVFNHLPSEYL